MVAITWMLVLTLAWGTPQARSAVVAHHLPWSNCMSMALKFLARHPNGAVAANCKREDQANEREA